MADSLSKWQAGEKPRERLIQKGPAALSDAELIAILVNTGCRGTSVMDLARRIINELGGIHSLGRYTVHEISKFEGMGNAKASRLLAACELGRRRERRHLKDANIIQGVEDAGRLLASRLRDCNQECFYTLYLDVKHRIIDEKLISRGGLSQTPVEPGQVLKPALACSAAAIIVAHNHPSGDPTPSEQDFKLTRKLFQAAQIVGVRLLDHLIIGDGENVSFAEKNFFEKEKNLDWN